MDQKMIPYFCHEGDMARAERTIKRLWILCILLVVLLVGSYVGFFYYESQFEDEVTTTQEITQDLDAGRGNAIINDGVHINGQGETDSKDNNHKNTQEENRR